MEATAANIDISNPTPRRRCWPAILFMIFSLAAITGPGLLTHVRNSADFYNFNDDARQQIFPFLRFSDPALFRGDPPADYFLACFPVGYKALYAVSASFLDPRTTSKALPYLLLAIMCGGTAWAAGRLQGKWAAWATLGFCLGTSVFIGRLTGGLPRSFAFPLYAFAVAALVTGRPVLLATVVCAGAAFYPTVAVVGGLSLAAWLLVVPARHRGIVAEWGIVRRLMLLAGTAAAAVLATLPVQRAAAAWGPVLRPADAGTYPELGPEGRYSEEDRPVGFFSAHNLRNFLYSPLAGVGGPWESGAALFARPERGIPVAFLGIAGLAGFVLLCRTSAAAKRLLCLPAAALLANVVAGPVSPYLYLPTRYQIYPFAMLAAVAFPAGIVALPSLLGSPKDPAASARWVALLACGVPMLLLTGPRISLKRGVDVGGAGDSGLTRTVTTHRAVYAFIALLPPDAVIAGWPDDLDNFPYLTARRALISHELHQAFHKQYADLMRQRMTGVIGASFSADPAALRRLRDDLHVSYFLVDRTRYGRKDGFTYFKPFGEEIARARAGLDGRTALVQNPPADWIALHDGDWLLLDLSKLPKADMDVRLSAVQPSSRATEP